MKKERWDNRMSLWTRLFYGVPDMETWYQQNPTHQDTIRYYTDLCKNDELPALNKTFKLSKEYITKYFPKRVLPEMSYEQIVNIIDSLKSIHYFFAETFLMSDNPKLPLNFKENHPYTYKHDRHYTIAAYKEDVQMGYSYNLDNSLCLFYYWDNENWVAPFSDFASMHSYSTNFEVITLPVFFNPKSFRDYALLCKYFSQPIKEAHEREIKEAKEAALRKVFKAKEEQRKKEYEIRKSQIELLNGLKTDLQSIQDETAKQMNQVAKEDIEIAKRLNNNYTASLLGEITKEAAEEGYDIETAKFY